MKAPAKQGRVAELEARLLTMVEAQRQLGGASYPLLLVRLAQLANEPAAAVLKSVQALERRGVLLLSLAVTPKLLSARAGQAHVLVPSDLQAWANSDALLYSALSVCHDEEARAFELNELTALVNTQLAAAFRAALRRRIGARDLPAGVGAVPWKQGESLLFLLDGAVLAGARQEPEEFERRFTRAFDELDRAAGGRNYVRLLALRQALADLPRAEFDAGLAALRRARRFTLDASDGRHERLTAEELAAGITEAGNLLVYVARRSDG